MSSRHAGYARSQAWKRLRRRVFDRDNWACTKCGRHGQKLECAHIVALADGGTNEADNLRSLCRACHLEETRRQIRSHDVAGQSDWERFIHAGPMQRRSRHRDFIG